MKETLKRIKADVILSALFGSLTVEYQEKYLQVL